ncbi:MAG: hypothetical protein U5K32_05045 [Bacteroidales bacterium]|nr:hypothetical protein [Bacteroidales bacterium]
MKMGTMKKILLLTLIILCSAGLSAQEAAGIGGSTGARVAELLKRMPVDNAAELKKQMEEMTAIGPEGRRQITAMVIPPGQGDDVAARFAVGSYSMYLTGYGHSSQRDVWEEECIEAVQAAESNEVKSFFLSQLQYIGSEKSLEYASGFLTDPKMCEQALAVIAACDSPDKEALLAMSLQISSLPCPASVINELADMKSDKAINEYISWYAVGDAGVQAAALNAMAASADRMVYDVLLSAAADCGYEWDSTGAAAALVQYARNIGDKGDVRSMEKICSEVINKGAVSYKLAALEALVHYKGYEALAYLLSEYKKGDKEYRKGVLSLASDIPGIAATRKWMELMGDVNDTAKAELIHMLGERGDPLAVPLIKKALFCPSAMIRAEAAGALAKIQGREAVDELIDYIRSYVTTEDQVAGYYALLTITDSRKRDNIARSIEGSDDISKGTMLMLLCAGGENRYFDLVMDYTDSSNAQLRLTALSCLKEVAEPLNISQLADLLVDMHDDASVKHIQDALIKAAWEIEAEKERVAVIAGAMEKRGLERKFLPVLSGLGGEQALDVVYRIFEKGNAEMRQLAYDAMKGWPDHSAAKALMGICASGNKNYSERAFYDYLALVSVAELPAERKLSMLKKIKPYALRDEQKSRLESMMESLQGER